MSSFKYTGYARVQWGNGLADSVHFIDYVSWRETIRVYPLDSTPGSAPHPPDAWQEYIGHITDHPAVHMVFLHCSSLP